MKTNFREPIRMNNYYDVLNVLPTATKTEVVESYQKLKKIFSEESIPIHGLFSADLLAEKAQEIEIAYQLLSDATKRESYDIELTVKKIIPHSSKEGIISFGIIKRVEEEIQKEIKKIEPELPEKSIYSKEEKNPKHLKKTEKPYEIEEYSGEALMRLRKEKKISLTQIIEDTKIKLKFLEALETENYSDLPARPYLRGFLAAYASCLKLDVGKVLQDYMRRYDHWKEQQTKKPSPLFED
jgi:hypothetical protein